MREWLKVGAMLMLGAGVLLLGIRGMLPDAQAQAQQDDVPVSGRCEVVQLALTDQLTAERYTAWMNGQIDQGRRSFMALPGPYPVVCAW